VVDPIPGDEALAIARTGSAANRAMYTGGRTLAYWDFEGAEALYSVIRKTDDVEAIAANLKVPQFQVQRVKDRLFFMHTSLMMVFGIFDADPLIGNAWQRLQNATHDAADIQLFQHELFEAKFEGIFKQNYRISHDAANRAGRPSGLE